MLVKWRRAAVAVVTAGARSGRRRDGRVMELHLGMLVRRRRTVALTAGGSGGGRRRKGATKMQLRMPASQCMGTVIGCMRCMRWHQRQEDGEGGGQEHGPLAAHSSFAKLTPLTTLHNTTQARAEGREKAAWQEWGSCDCSQVAWSCSWLGLRGKLDTCRTPCRTPCLGKEGTALAHQPTTTRCPSNHLVINFVF